MSARMRRLIQVAALALAMMLGVAAVSPVQVSAQDTVATEAAGAVNTVQDAVDTDDDDGDDGGRWGLLGLLGLAGLAGLLKRPARPVVVDDHRANVTTGTSTRP